MIEIVQTSNKMNISFISVKEYETGGRQILKKNCRTRMGPM